MLSMNSSLINYQKIAVIVSIVTITAIYFFINPAEKNLGVQCLFFKATGLFCPGCGGQRAFHALLHGNFEQAFDFNPLIFIILPLIGIKFYEEIFEKQIVPAFIFSRRFLIVFIIFIVIFTFYRNILLNLTN